MAPNRKNSSPPQKTDGWQEREHLLSAHIRALQDLKRVGLAEICVVGFECGWGQLVKHGVTTFLQRKRLTKLRPKVGISSTSNDFSKGSKHVNSRHNVDKFVQVTNLFPRAMKHFIDDIVRPNLQSQRHSYRIFQLTQNTRFPAIRAKIMQH
jgi:hypothetical protein